MFPGTGAIRDSVDKRDFQAAAVMGAPIVDWSKGSGLLEPPDEDQNGSSSCVAQAWSYYHWQLRKKDFSRRDIYANIHLQAGGAYIRDGGLQIVNYGQATRDESPDYFPETEGAMRDMGGLSIDKEKSDQELNSFVLPNDITNTAATIKQYKGVVFGVMLNPDDWTDTANPKPPTSATLSHALYLFDFHLHDNQKCVIAKSSWGRYGNTSVHHIKEDYFLTGNTLNPWTLIPKEYSMPEIDITQFMSKDGITEGIAFKLPTPEALQALQTLILTYGGTIKPQVPSSEL